MQLLSLKGSTSCSMVILSQDWGQTSADAVLQTSD